ncbi:Protein phosphatase 1 regulatory subunit sds22 [Emmonsiellopsis sp. PD_5]|nr:Protein phosphatase 1 regulatory subunit sds22 [Emmonsiellopsis sp. PD_5]
MTEPTPPQPPLPLPTTEPEPEPEPDTAMRDSKGWDGKLRVERHAQLMNPEALEDPDYSDENAPPREEIEADEDLLAELEDDVDDIDLVHCRISSLPALRLERFTNLEKLCLRQNEISRIEFPANLGPTLVDLDLYDNQISHIRGLEHLTKLTSLDFSFNNIKHIKNVSHLVQLTDLYFVQNRIQKIEGLDGLTKLRNLELAANRIRDIENLDSLTALEELWLGKNKIVEIKNISTLSSLKILSLPSNRLTSISGLSDLPNLEELYVSHNAIPSISGLESNTNLRVLDISNNQISKLGNLSHLTHLEELWASSNRFASFDEVEKELRDKEELKTVYFEGNPLQLMNPVLYRNKVRLALPQIQQIDANPKTLLQYLQWLPPPSIVRAN